MDLFGPMPTRVHVIVVQDSVSRFPANPAETFMKPLGETMKIVYEHKTSKRDELQRYTSASDIITTRKYDV